MKLIYSFLTIGAAVANSNGDAEQRQAMKPGRFYFGKNKALFSESDEKDWLRIRPVGKYDQASQAFKDMTEFYFEGEKKKESPFFPKKPADELNYRIRQVKTDRYLCASKSGKAMLSNEYSAKNCEWNINIAQGEKMGIKIVKAGSQHCLWSKSKSMVLQPCENEHVIKIDERMLFLDEKRGDNFKPEDDTVGEVGEGGDGDDTAENEENGDSQGFDLDGLKLLEKFGNSVERFGHFAKHNTDDSTFQDRELIHMLEGIIRYLVKTEKLDLNAGSERPGTEYVLRESYFF